MIKRYFILTDWTTTTYVERWIIVERVIPKLSVGRRIQMEDNAKRKKSIQSIGLARITRDRAQILHAFAQLEILGRSFVVSANRRIVEGFFDKQIERLFTENVTGSAGHITM